jgi:hypothetical protein
LSLADPLVRARAALLDHLPKDAILARYQAAGGQKLVSGKFANPESSAALVANAFGLFGERPDLLSLPADCLGGHEAQRVDLEAQMRFPWSGGLHPWLDVGVQTAERLIGIESKRYEPFRDHKTATFSAAYARPVWGQAMGPYEAMRDALSAGRRFAFLDAAQLVKHAFGLRTEGQRTGRQAVLCYLYAEPRAFPDGRAIRVASIQAHRDEVASFTAEVSSAVADVVFCSLSYAELLRHWEVQPALADHAAALAARFDMGQS